MMIEPQTYPVTSIKLLERYCIVLATISDASLLEEVAYDTYQKRQRSVTAIYDSGPVIEHVLP